jgi:GT2 family glycosyltransferase
MGVLRDNLDGLNGSSVVGWVIPTISGASHCVIRISDESGQELASGLADRARPDLDSLGLGRTDISFCIPVPDHTRRARLHVYADDVEFKDSPLLIGRGLFDGVLGVADGCAFGWVMERSQSFTAPEVQVTDQNGTVVAVMQSRHGAAMGDPKFSPAYFHGQLGQDVFGAGEVELTASVYSQPFARRSCNLPLQGFLELVRYDRCVGWLLSPDVPNRRFEIEVYRDGTLIAKAKTVIAREDVQGVYPDAVSPGFDVVLPNEAMSQVQAATISVRLGGREIDLFGGARVVGSPAAVVSAARRVAGAILRTDVGVGPAERAVVRLALADFLAQHRRGTGLMSLLRPDRVISGQTKRRLTIVVPCYRGVDVTRQCIVSALDDCNADGDHLVLVNDASPDPGMAPLLAEFSGLPAVTVLTNDVNQGFVRSVNRALRLCRDEGGDVVLLNSDTEVFAGAFDELHRTAHGRPDIGTVTPLSNIATIFSYPHERRQCQSLDDISWSNLARTALEVNRNLVIDVPTGHGFCLYIREDTLRDTGLLDEGYGRGYGEENDFCARASDLGYCHVLAASVFVRHLESVSFGSDKEALIKANFARLSEAYPEYPAIISSFVQTEGLRRARWGLDSARLESASAAGQEFVLLVVHQLGGGTAQALKDIETSIGYEGAIKITVFCQENGLLELQCDNPSIITVFTPGECDNLFAILTKAAVHRVFVHQLIGFKTPFIEKLAEWIGPREGTFYAHDFYAICPRVTMIDAFGSFCDIAPVDVCARCVDRGGAHEASRMTELSPAAHRGLFGRALTKFRNIVAPSDSASSYFKRAFPNVTVTTSPHPERLLPSLTPVRRNSDDEIILIGAIGPHKGSGLLLELANRAALTHPHLRFKVIGYTNIDRELTDVGNVSITGPYEAGKLSEVIETVGGKIALFLHRWPETYSYTLSEALKFGFIPVVPDVGAPAERLRALRCGVIYPLTIETGQLLQILADILSSDALENNGPSLKPTKGIDIAAVARVSRPKSRRFASNAESS